MTSTTTESWLFRATVVLVALAPLPFASNRPFPAALVAFVAATMLALWGLHILRGGRIAVPPRRIWLPLVLFGLACLWIFIQWIPLGKGSPLWAIAGEALQRELPSRISINPDATLSGLMRLVSYAIVFWLTLQLTYEPARARTAMTAAIVIGSIYAVYGIIVFMLGNHWILFYRKWAYLDSLTSTFVNRNSFATFAGICLVCTSAAIFIELQDLWSGRRPFRTKLTLVLEHVLVRARWKTFCFFALLVALMLTASRAGIASTAIAHGVLALAFVNRARNKMRSLMILGGIGAMGVLLALTIAGGPLLQRYESKFLPNSEESRLEVYAMTVTAIQTDPWFGTGFGTFPDVIPAYRGPEESPLLLRDKAHNTYLENALEMGVPAALTLNLAIGLLALRTVLGAKNRRRQWIYPAIGAAATALVGIHSMFDFSLQIPAVSILYAFVMGFAVSQSWSRGKPAG